VTATPARRATATIAASVSSASVAPTKLFAHRHMKTFSRFVQLVAGDHYTAAFRIAIK
jgi:hypothetical protein